MNCRLYSLTGSHSTWCWTFQICTTILTHAMTNKANGLEFLWTLSAPFLKNPFPYSPFCLNHSPTLWPWHSSCPLLCLIWNLWSTELKLSLGMSFVPSSPGHPTQAALLSSKMLIGKLIVLMPQKHDQIIIGAILSSWRFALDISINSMQGHNRYLINFSNPADQQKVLSKGPSSIKGNLLNL